MTLSTRGTYDVTDVAYGSASDDWMVGTEFDDVIDLSQGGRDSIFAGGGLNKLYFGNAFTKGDYFNRYENQQEGVTLIYLQGTYDSGFALDWEYVSGFVFMSGYDATFARPTDTPLHYDLVLDGLYSLGHPYILDASGLAHDESLALRVINDGSRPFAVDYRGGAGIDTIISGVSNDIFTFEGGTLTSGDAIDGHFGLDTLVLRGDHAITFASDEVNLKGFEFVVLKTGQSGGVGATNYHYDLTFEDVTSGFFYFTVDASELGENESLSLHGGAEHIKALGGSGADTLIAGDGSLSLLTTVHNILYGGGGNDVLGGGNNNDYLDGGDGADEIFGGAGNDAIVGGAGADRITGGLGKDIINTGDGADVIIYQSGADSTSAAFDQIGSFDFAQDKIAVSVTSNIHRDSDVRDSSMNTFNASTFATATRDVLTPNGVSVGYLGAFTFLFVDQNGIAGFQDGSDLVIQFSDYTNLPASGVGFIDVPGM